MTKDKRNSIQVWSAVGMLACGTIMAFASMFTPPIGEISNGALWYTGQCFLYAGGMFGIGAWARSEIESKIKEMNG